MTTIHYYYYLQTKYCTTSDILILPIFDIKTPLFCFQHKTCQFCSFPSPAKSENGISPATLLPCFPPFHHTSRDHCSTRGRCCSCRIDRRCRVQDDTLWQSRSAPSARERGRRLSVPSRWGLLSGFAVWQRYWFHRIHPRSSRFALCARSPLDAVPPAGGPCLAICLWISRARCSFAHPLQCHTVQRGGPGHSIPHSWKQPRPKVDALWAHARRTNYSAQ